MLPVTFITDGTLVGDNGTSRFSSPGIVQGKGLSMHGGGIKGPSQDRTGQDRTGQSPQRQAVIREEPCTSGRGQLHYPVKFN